MEWLQGLWRRIAQLDEDASVNKPTQQQQRAHQYAEERADRTLDFARNELDRWERELALATGGRHRDKRKRT